MNVLGVIPARGGSQSIPRKNVVELAGRPLLHYTCAAALASRRLTRVILSTDDDDIARVGAAAGVEAPFRRPASLSDDEVPMVDVLRHAIEWLEQHQGFRADVVVVLQPTSPLRRAEHIDAAVDLLRSSGADSVVSVVEVPHQFNPVSVLRIVDGRAVRYVDGPLILRRQDKPRVYARNGPAVIATGRSTVVDAGTLYGDDCRPYVMAPDVSIDIDTPFDLAVAELLLSHAATPGHRS